MSNSIYNPEIHEAYVYIWFNHTDGKIYIGKHKGHELDGYICSSQSEIFWNDFEDETKGWSREIVFGGTDSECIEYEDTLLIGANMNHCMFYNNGRSRGPVMTDEVRAKLSKAHKGKKRKPHSAETKAKISAAHKGKKLSLEHRVKLSASKMGKKLKPHTAETKAKISAAHKGKLVSAETREKQSAAHTGKVISVETRAKMSEARLRFNVRRREENQSV